jgi:hydrogenase maturation protease
MSRAAAEARDEAHKGVSREARVVALGHAFARDDGAALRVAARLRDEGVEVVLAGRPGPGLLELLDAPTVLLDVIRHGAAPGELVTLPLASLAEASVAEDTLSSHGLGPAAALKLGAALGRPVPRGLFVGIGGHHFAPGDTLSDEVDAALDAFTTAARDALACVRRGDDECTSTG